jgi:ADP-ribose pyrophosphatase YjhB (NUDIX family)
MKKKTKIIKATLGFLTGRDELWLAIKADKIGKGKLNGYGGKIKKGETPEQCMERELPEESGVTAHKEYFEKVGVINFHNTKKTGEKFICRAYIYLIRFFKGEPKETETGEMLNPQKFLKDRLPLRKLMPADKDWLPLVLNGLKVTGSVFYGPNQKKLIKKSQIKIVKVLPKN